MWWNAASETVLVSQQVVVTWEVCHFPNSDVDVEVCSVWFCEQVISWDFGVVCFFPQFLNSCELFCVRGTCSNIRSDLSSQKSHFHRVICTGGFILQPSVMQIFSHEFINGRNYCFTFPKDVIKTEDYLEVRKKISMLLLSSRLNRREV